jgi:hypothetical protein
VLAACTLRVPSVVQQITVDGRSLFYDRPYGRFA